MTFLYNTVFPFRRIMYFSTIYTFSISKFYISCHMCPAYFLLGLFLGILCLGLLSLVRCWSSLRICFLPSFHPTIALNHTLLPPLLPKLLLQAAFSSFWANKLNIDSCLDCVLEVIQPWLTGKGNIWNPVSLRLKRVMSAIAKQQYIRLGQEFVKCLCQVKCQSTKCVKEKNFCASQNVILSCSK